MELQNSTVLVTGATGNMGPYVTDSLIDSGANVIGTYVTDTARDDIGTRAENADAVSYYQVDLTDQALSKPSQKPLPTNTERLIILSDSRAGSRWAASATPTPMPSKPHLIATRRRRS
ncbi:NAD-dependent epimerase/dehydratase family protein [Haloarcula regularis]|uniref:NAD-dependent epimerase/dehydratase family protein n=1 Tax=Haloarcula regularis TaxID=3033392 RepID=UPI003204CE91